MEDSGTQKKKKPGLLSAPAQKMGLDSGRSSVKSPGLLASMAQGKPLGQMVNETMPNMAEIALNQRTSSVGLGQPDAALGQPQMTKVKNGVARNSGQTKTKIFGSQD